jgi:FkbM family methyltransferase
MFTRLSYIHRAYRYRYRVDPAELRFVCNNLQPGQVAGDIGCHKGAYTYWMRRRVGPSGAVYAFEPQPDQVAYLRAAFDAMNYDNVAIVPLAASNRSTEMPLYVPAGSGLTHAASLEQLPWYRDHVAGNHPDNGFTPRPLDMVQTTTLDEFFTKHRPPNFLKIDVEGHELAVVEGARHTLATQRPTVLLECETRHRPEEGVRPVFDLLESLGYSGTFFENGGRRPLAEFDPAEHQRYDPTRPEWLPPNYVNNFAFVPV